MEWGIRNGEMIVKLRTSEHRRFAEVFSMCCTIAAVLPDGEIRESAKNAYQNLSDLLIQLPAVETIGEVPK